MSEIADILDRAAMRLAAPGVWGQSCGPARGFHCAATAIGAEGADERHMARNFFAKHIGVEARNGAIWRWNDDPERTLDEVLTALREAAAKARGEPS